MKQHYTAQYLLKPTHRVTVNLIGCGGTGSQVLSALSRMNEALTALDHPGLLVTVFDGDQVTEANVGRQLYSPADIGQNKASVSVTRVNRYFATDWRAAPVMYSAAALKGDNYTRANITISCVDSAAARIRIGALNKKTRKMEPDQDQFYWLDFGNLHKTGQVVLGTVGEVDQNPYKGEKFGVVNAATIAAAANRVAVLPDVIAMFPELKKIKEKNQGPSCSLAQALGKQDLFINSALANLGCNILWSLFRKGVITHHGLYLNLDTMNVNPIKIA
jgi:PRTRC genetic system ThiF family protein